MVARRVSVLTDGSPEWLPQVEQHLVGGAMLGEVEHVILACATASPEDFRDPTLGLIWSVLPSLDCPCTNHVARALDEQGELHEVGGYPRLVELAGTQNAYLYTARVFLEEHARLVHEEGEKRRRLQAIRAEYVAVFEGKRPANVVPLYDRPEYAGLGDSV